MTGTWNSTGLTRGPIRRAPPARRFAFACALIAASWPALAQEPQQPAADPLAAPAQVPVQAPRLVGRPGLVDVIGRWFGDSKTRIDEQIKGTHDTLVKGTQNTFGDIGTKATDAVKGAAKEATGALVSLPATRMVIGRQRCPLAPNGAPDCAPAAVALCKYRGFTGGRGLDIDSAQKCPTWIWLSGRTPQEHECKTETFVTRAVCQ